MPGARPSLGVADAQLLLTKVFGLPTDPARQGKELDSYCDRNFLFHCIDNAPSAVVLKVHNSSDSGSEARLTVEAQSCALAHLAQAQIPCPEVLPSISGSCIETVELPSALQPGETHTHLVRCFKYMEGNVLGHAQEVPRCLFVSLGNMMGRVNAALATFHHPGLSRTHAWSFETAADTIQAKLPLLQEVLAPQQRSLILWAVQQWRDAQATGLLAGLARQACHGDGNEMNILVNADCTAASALLDFGDMCEMYAVAEPSITLAYALLLEIGLQQQRRRQGLVREDSAGGRGQEEAGAEAKQDLEAALESGKAVLEGYQQARPLSTAELAVMPLFVATRVALSLTMGAAAAQADPGNAQYLLMTQGPGWVLLQALKDGVLKIDTFGTAAAAGAPTPMENPMACNY